MKKKVEIKILAMILIPLILTASVLMITFIMRSRSSSLNLYGEKLHAIANILNTTYNEAIDGDWNIKDGVVYKGDTIIDNTMIDSVSNENIDITIFIGDVRYLTTVKNKSGVRQTGTKASSIVTKEVYKNGKEYIDERLDVNGVDYYAYYMPLTNKDGSIVGMFFVGEKRQLITDSIYAVNSNIFYISIVILLFVILVSVFVSKPLVKIIITISNNISKMSDGELYVEYKVPSINKEDELGILASNTEKLSKSLISILTMITNQSDTLYDKSVELSNIASNNINAVESISSAIDDVAKGAEEQANDITSTMGKMQELSGVLNSVLTQVEKLSGVASGLKDYSDNTKNVMVELTKVNEQAKLSVQGVVEQTNDTISAMKEIDKILLSIQDIATQTNLLSLNASIEAARAGEAGRGFSVVASEVKKLSDDCSNASKEISVIITNITEKIKKSGVLANELESSADNQIVKLGEANESVEEIISGIAMVFDETQGINKEIKSLDVVQGSINSTIENLSAISEENAASSSETASSSTELISSSSVLNGIAEDIKAASELLKSDISKFKF